MLVFIPLLASHNIWNLQLLLAAGVAFVCFSACASAVYLVNDLVDVEADRRHSSKKNRPFASGALPPMVGWVAAPALAAAAIFGAMAISPTLAFMLCIYIAVSVTYTAKLKQLAALDVLVLAGLYTIRIYAGGAAAGVAVSSWLAAFSMFLFLSLAFLKRYVELSEMRNSERHAGFGRGYYAEDQIPVAIFGCASGYMAVLVYALYVSSPHVAALYANPDRLWFVCPLLLYWITRIWLLATRGEVHDDPLIFAFRDVAAYVTIALTLLISFWAL